MAFLSIHTQFENLGDALINRELARRVAERTTTVIDLSRCPPSFAQTMGASQLPATTLLRKFGYARLLVGMLMARLAGKDCLFFLNPGGLGGALRGRKSLAMAANNVLLGLLRLIGIKTALIGVSFERMGPRERFLWRWRCALLHALWVRDAVTAAYLDHCGFQVDAVVPDLSFGLYIDLPDDSHTDAKDDRAVAFSFRFDRSDTTKTAQLQDFVDVIVATLASNRPLIFVAQVQRDVAPMTQLYDHVRSYVGDRASLCIATRDIDACLAAYRQCRALYSNRLHALLMAMFAGAAPCAVLHPGLGTKFEGIFADLDLDDSIHQLGASPLPKALPRAADPQRVLAQAQALHDAFDRLIGPAKRTPVNTARSLDDERRGFAS